MFDHTHYVPVLKVRRGERDALKVLAASARTRLTPLLEVQPVAWDFKLKKPKRSLDVHLQSQIDGIAKAWTGEGPVFLDAGSLDGTPAPNGQPAVAFALDRARALQVRAVPVTAPSRSASEQAAVAAAVKQDGRGVCFRLGPNDYGQEDALKVKLAELQASLSVSPSEVDLVLDFQVITAAMASTFAVAAATILAILPDVNTWRSLTLISTAFPETLGAFQPETIKPAPRGDWMFWTSVVGLKDKYPRVPTFGDYAIQHPDLPDLDPRLLMRAMKATIRYTTLDGWLIVRGDSLQDYTYEQFRALSKKLMARPEYSGPAFSWGDEYISKCAAGTVPTGNQSTWRTVGTSHHLTLVTDQVSSYLES